MTPESWLGLAAVAFVSALLAWTIRVANGGADYGCRAERRGERCCGTAGHRGIHRNSMGWWGP